MPEKMTSQNACSNGFMFNGFIFVSLQVSLSLFRLPKSSVAQILLSEKVDYFAQYSDSRQSTVWQHHCYRRNNYSYCLFKMVHNYFLQISFSLFRSPPRCFALHSTPSPVLKLAVMFRVTWKFGSTGFIRRTIPLFCSLFRGKPNRNTSSLFRLSLRLTQKSFSNVP